MQKYFEESTDDTARTGVGHKGKLKARFMRRYPTLDDVPLDLICYKAVDPYAHVMMQYEFMELFRFIRLEDTASSGLEPAVRHHFTMYPKS